MPPVIRSAIEQRIWPITTAGLAIVLGLVIAADLGAPWRPIAALAFLAVGPGASLVPLINFEDMAMALMVVIPLSFALVALTSAALFYAGLWSPDRELVVVVGLCLAGLVLQRIDHQRHRRVRVMR